MKKNKVARILKIYAIINAIVVILASIIISATEEEPLIFIIGFAAGVCVNFAIYAFGEVVDLLAQIRDNTQKTEPVVAASLEDQLPDI